MFSYRYNSGDLNQSKTIHRVAIPDQTIRFFMSENIIFKVVSQI